MLLFHANVPTGKTGLPKVNLSIYPPGYRWYSQTSPNFLPPPQHCYTDLDSYNFAEEYSSQKP